MMTIVFPIGLIAAMMAQSVLALADRSPFCLYFSFFFFLTETQVCVVLWKFR